MMVIPELQRCGTSVCEDGGGPTLVQVGQTLVLLFDSWRRGGTQDVLEGARRSGALRQEPGLFML